MLPSVFISRNLSKESIIYERLKERAYLISFSLLEFNAIEFEVIPEVDFIFFYSKKAVHYFFKNNRNFKDVPFACMGKGTNSALMDFGYTASFIGAGNPEEVAKQFLKIAKGKKVLFPKAKQSRNSIENILEDQIESHSIVIYENRKKTQFDFPNANILVFTSPLNAEAYFDLYAHQEEKIIVIGKATASKLNELGIDCQMAKNPTEEELLNSILQNL